MPMKGGSWMEGEGRNKSEATSIRIECQPKDTRRSRRDDRSGGCVNRGIGHASRGGDVTQNLAISEKAKTI